MKTKPLHRIVNGDNLAKVLGELKDSGAMVESIDCRVGGNAAYQINFIDGVASSESGESRCQRKHKISGETPDAINSNFVNLAGNKNGEDVEGAPDPSAHEIRHSRKLDSLPSNFPAHLLADQVAQESNAESGQKPFNAKPVTLAAGKASPASPSCTCRAIGAQPGIADRSGDSGSIYDRMAKLQSVAVANGRVRRSKQRGARLPHNSE